MKTVFRISAILNFLLVVIAFICVFIAAIDKNVYFCAVSTLTVIASIFPAAMMLALYNDFKDEKE